MWTRNECDEQPRTKVKKAGKYEESYREPKTKLEKNYPRRRAQNDNKI